MHLNYYHGNAVLSEFNLKAIASAFKKSLILALYVEVEMVL